MPFVTYKCQTCQKNVTETSHFDIEGFRLITLSCGHTNTEQIILKKAHQAESLVSENGKKLYKFQIDGVRACELSNMNFLFADEMRLGKTIQILAAIKLHPECMPVAVICKSMLKEQWDLEIGEWFGLDATTQIIETSKDGLGKADFYIFSFDILRRFNGKLVEWFQKKGIKTVILDEVQHIKNWNSERSKNVTALCNVVKYKLAASGTPIKNNASEYFPILNILQPQIFRYYQSFVREWCESYWNGYGYKVGGIKNIKRFQEFTKDFIIRRTRDEVEIDFPDLNRTFSYHELKEDDKKAYEQTETEFVDYVEHNNDSAFEKANNILARLAIARHQVGLSKIDPTVDFVDDFLRQTERKLTLFVHHIDVADLLQIKINAIIDDINKELGSKLNYACRIFGGRAQEAFSTAQEFQNIGANRILIAPTLAAGEGLTLHKCSDCLMVEREWNPPNEEQAECRFFHSESKVNKINATYLIALQTVDEYLNETVERKRAILKNTLDGQNYIWSESNVVKEIAEILIRKHQNKWRAK